MSWLTTITSLFGSLNPLLGIFGAGLGALITYFVNSYITKQAQKKAAIDAMTADMNAHAGDGAQSVGDMQSAQAQLAALKQQAAQPPQGVKNDPVPKV